MTSGRERGRDGMADKPRTAGVSAIRLHGGLDTILQVTSKSRVSTLVFLLNFFTDLPNPITRKRYRTVQTYQVDDGEPFPIDRPVTAAQPPQLPPHRLRPLFRRTGTAGEHLTQGDKGEAGPLIGLQERCKSFIVLPRINSDSHTHDHLHQCSGSMTFWCGSGSADPCL
jgi:hypothetical protein